MATPGRQLVDKRSRSDQRYVREQEQNLLTVQILRQADALARRRRTRFLDYMSNK
jgi:hypothetical protein